MKNLIITLSALIIISCIVLSCHKSKHSVTPPPTPASLISGVTAIRHMTSIDTGGGYFTVDITWNFSGFSPIIVTPNTDTLYLGHQQVIFSGSNVTQITYYNYGPFLGNYSPLTANITYTGANQLDTVTFKYQYAVMGAEKVVFQYSGDQIIGAIVAHTSNVSDTFHWSTADLYYFTYIAGNISKAIVSRYNGAAGRDSEITNYFTGTRINNFAGSLPTFLSIYFPEQSTSSLDQFLFEMPIYMNTNIVDSTETYNTVLKLTTITDSIGKISKRISGSDTTFYFY